ncbi:hypothetical protein PVAND_012894 [Polypedilum vanderplanki]|uniref:Uncharacterized protein n=1 Tax=Polypedilum vanderplanki TaxID=319348 RepID=A0A9J6CNS9_POLVA|nr:hypothetical protein PVAND_012894 [Polypedilum vanderplanki]
MSASNSNNENNEKSINVDNISSSLPNNTSQAANQQTNTTTTSTQRKKPTKKPSFRNSQPPINTSYEHHLERWLENASKMNFDYNNLDGNNWPLMNSSGATNRKGNHHLQNSSADPISLPPHINLDSTPSINAFMNFNTSFRQQYPHLIQRQQSASPISNDPISLGTQPDFFSLPTFGSNVKYPSTDQEKLNDVISQSKRFNELLIDDAPHHGNMSVSNNNSTRPNESSAEDELDDDVEGHTDEDDKQKLENGAMSSSIKNKNVLHTLLKQIQLLHETNSKLFRSLHETKVEMEAIKYAPHWGLRHRRDSVSGLSVHSQPFGYANAGIASPAPTYHSQGGYTPGVVTDLIREVRDAGRIQNESLMNRVKALIEEKSWTHNETSMRVLRELEEVKVHLHNLKLERQTTNDRITKLEDEVRTIKTFLGVNSNPFQQYSQSFTPTNSNFAMNDQLKRSNLSLNYGVMNSTGDSFQLDEHSNFNSRRHPSQSPPKPHNNSINEADEDSFDKSHVIQMEKDTLKLRRDLQDALASKKQAETRIIALEHMVTSLKSPQSQPTNNVNHHHSTTNNPNNNSANKNSLQSEFHQPQQHQLQIQINGGEVKRKSVDQATNGSVTVGKLLSPPKSVKASQVTLSAAGPITDL